MANQYRGEVAFKVGDTTYTLKPTTNAICEMETASGRTFPQILKGIAADGGGGFSDIRLFLWGLLRANHPEVTIEKAGDLIDQSGGVVGVVSKLEQAVRINTPKPNGRAANPPKARSNGTGGNST